MVPFLVFLVSVVTPCYFFTSGDLELGVTNETEHVPFVFLAPDDLSQSFAVVPLCGLGIRVIMAS